MLEELHLDIQHHQSGPQHMSQLVLDQFVHLSTIFTQSVNNYINTSRISHQVSRLSSQC